MKTLLMIFSIVLILPFVSNIKNSAASSSSADHAFIWGYKIAENHNILYYYVCQKKIIGDYGTASTRDMKECLQGVLTYKEIHKNNKK